MRFLPFRASHPLERGVLGAAAPGKKDLPREADHRTVPRIPRPPWATTVRGQNQEMSPTEGSFISKRLTTVKPPLTSLTFPHFSDPD